jgi:hypothetical protein
MIWMRDVATPGLSDQAMYLDANGLVQLIKEAKQELMRRTKIEGEA